MARSVVVVGLGGVVFYLQTYAPTNEVRQHWTQSVQYWFAKSISARRGFTTLKKKEKENQKQTLQSGSKSSHKF